jgi:diaminopimelate epimerase
MKGFKFTKMQALGNDFIVIDAVNQSLQLSADEVRALADRHRGIGFDQLLLVEPATSQEADFRYRIFNADGGEVAQCGNGARCLARFILEKGLSTKEEVIVETLEGRLRLRCLSGNRVSVSLGVPRFKAQEVPHLLTGSGPVFQLAVEGRNLELFTVNVGNPHALMRVDPLEKAEVSLIGGALAVHPAFPEGVNVSFLSLALALRNTIFLRVYERGAGETQACGSGACAAAVIALSQGWCKGTVTVKQHGGDLEVQWGGEGEEVWLTGPAQWVFSGEWSGKILPDLTAS